MGVSLLTETQPHCPAACLLRVCRASGKSSFLIPRAPSNETGTASGNGASAPVRHAEDAPALPITGVWFLHLAHVK